jgi:hypothetical protein
MSFLTPEDKIFVVVPLLISDHIKVYEIWEVLFFESRKETNFEA